jgi:hypothetical protein
MGIIEGVFIRTSAIKKVEAIYPKNQKDFLQKGKSFPTEFV